MQEGIKDEEEFINLRVVSNVRNAWQTRTTWHILWTPARCIHVGSNHAMSVSASCGTHTSISVSLFFCSAFRGVQESQELHFRIKRTTKMSKLMETYCKKQVHSRKTRPASRVCMHVCLHPCTCVAHFTCFHVLFRVCKAPRCASSLMVRPSALQTPRTRYRQPTHVYACAMGMYWAYMCNGRFCTSTHTPCAQNRTRVTHVCAIAFQLEMEDKDVIDVMSQQTGGAW